MWITFLSLQYLFFMIYWVRNHWRAVLSLSSSKLNIQLKKAVQFRWEYINGTFRTFAAIYVQSIQTTRSKWHLSISGAKVRVKFSAGSMRIRWVAMFCWRFHCLPSERVGLRVEFLFRRRFLFVFVWFFILRNIISIGIQFNSVKRFSNAYAFAFLVTKVTAKTQINDRLANA